MNAPHHFFSILSKLGNTILGVLNSGERAVVIEELVVELKDCLKTYSCRETYVHTLGSKVFEVCKPTNNLKRKVSLKLYEILSEVLPEPKEVKLLSNVVYVRSCEGRSFWYRLGLALSDGSPLSRSKIIFSLSTPCTVEAVIRAFGETKTYLGRIMISRASGKIIPVFNVVATDNAVADTIRSLRKHGGSRNNPVISKLIKDLKSHRERLASFLAGAIDGDGAISDDDVRLSVSTDDPLYTVISNVFSKCVRYDNRKYLLRISTNALRLNRLFETIISNVICSHKRQRLVKLYSKSCTRFRLHGLPLNEDLIEHVATLLLRDPSVRALLRDAHVRKHGKYRYFVVSVNRETFNLRKEVMTHILKVLSEELGLDLLPALRNGNRELIVYNQDLVTVLEILKKRVCEAGTAG